MRPSRRRLTRAAVLIGGLVALLVLVTQFMTRTSFGMERARRYAANWLAGRVNGEVSLGRISGGGLLDGVTIHQVVIRGPDGRDVAVKLLHQARSRPRFEREVRLLATLGDAEGFVPLLDTSDSPYGPYLVMPLLAGGSLRERLLMGALGIGESVEPGAEVEVQPFFGLT